MTEQCRHLIISMRPYAQIWIDATENRVDYAFVVVRSPVSPQERMLSPSEIVESMVRKDQMSDYPTHALDNSFSLASGQGKKEALERIALWNVRRLAKSDWLENSNTGDKWGVFVFRLDGKKYYQYVVPVRKRALKQALLPPAKSPTYQPAIASPPKRSLLTSLFQRFIPAASISDPTPPVEIEDTDEVVPPTPTPSPALGSTASLPIDFLHKSVQTGVRCIS